MGTPPGMNVWYLNDNHVPDLEEVSRILTESMYHPRMPHWMKIRSSTAKLRDSLIKYSGFPTREMRQPDPGIMHRLGGDDSQGLHGYLGVFYNREWGFWSNQWRLWSQFLEHYYDVERRAYSNIHVSQAPRRQLLNQYIGYMIGVLERNKYDDVGTVSNATNRRLRTLGIIYGRDRAAQKLLVTRCVQLLPQIHGLLQQENKTLGKEVEPEITFESLVEEYCIDEHTVRMAQPTESEE